MIIAVCGESGAGKSTTTAILAREGFRAHSLSGLLRQEAEAAHDRPTRAAVQAHGRATQASHGNDYYARRLVETSDLLAGGDVVIDGLRNLDEATYLRRRAAEAGSTFRLLALVLDPETRFARVTGRARGGDPTHIAQFRADDARANGAAGDFQNNRALIEAADCRIENTGDPAALTTKLRALVKRARPSAP